MDERGKTGRKGEDIVCQYLTELGHTILDRNWRSGHLELDIVSLASDGLHFVEVKSRKAPVMAAPQENVGPVKQRRIATAASRYLALKDKRLPQDLDAWLDVAAVTFDSEGARVEYFPNAYTPMYL